jgi:acyl-coenzyme A synthetase/AMP-(fatty) acid ligase
MKIFSEEIEEVINSVPGVQESRVVAKEHLEFGQVPLAEVVFRNDGVISEGAIERLRDQCRQRLSAFKVPVEFRQVNMLRKTASGKVMR